MKFVVQSFVFLSFICLSGIFSFAQTSNNRSGEERDPDVLFSVGGGMIASPRPYVGTDAKIFPIPVVNARYNRFFFQGIRGGFEFLQKGNLVGSGYLQAQFQGLEPEDSDFLTGMNERRKSADAGLELTYRGRPVGFRVGFLSDVLGRSKGQELSFMATSGIPLGKVLILGGFGPRWISDRRVDYYFGVRPGESLPGRPAYVGENTWNWDLSLSTIWNISERWQLFALFNREGLGSEIKNSPLIEQSAAYSLLLSITYRIK